MKSRISAALVLTAFVGIAAGAPPAPPKVGDLAPDFTLSDENGKQITLSAARGEKTVLVFYRGYW